MDAGSSGERLLHRIDAEVAQVARKTRGPVLAYSGGLASLILAALLRKRVDLDCEAVGLRGSSDVEAARVAEKFLDYPVRLVRPSAAAALRAARSIALRDPALTAADVVALVPLVLLEGRHPHARVVGGFGLTWESAGVRAFLAEEPAILPGFRPRAPAAPPRARLLEVADLLGLPESFSRAARRRPAEGSAVGPSIRSAAHAEHVSLERLLRPRSSVRDYQERKATRVIPKSSPVD